MAAYLVSFDPLPGYSDPEGMSRYAAAVKEIVESFGGIYSMQHRRSGRAKDSGDTGFMVMIEFPSMNRLMEFYKSDAYRPWRDLRQKSGKTDILVNEG